MSSSSSYLKRHTEALVKSVGIEPAAALTGKSKATLGRYYSDHPEHSDRFMPIDAVVALEALLAMPQVCERREHEGVVTLWHRLASRSTASPKVWMDAYLAAFAISGGLCLVTLDHDFKSYENQGLELALLNP